MKVGDRVVCVRTATSNLGGYKVVKGKVYTINDEVTCNCNKRAFDVGISHDPKKYESGCFTCDITYRRQGVVYVDSMHFAPIQYSSATEELANKKVVEEKSDIPIKEPQKEKV